jgi:hypothetical protein
VPANETVEVQFREVPVALYIELQSHSDSVMRDLVLSRAELERPAGAPISAADSFLLQWRERLRLQVEQAQAEGRAHVDLTAQYPRSVVEPFRRYVAMLEEADEAAARGELLVPPPSADVLALRRWLVREISAQVFERAAPTPFRRPGGTPLPDHASR